MRVRFAWWNGNEARVVNGNEARVVNGNEARACMGMRLGW